MRNLRNQERSRRVSLEITYECNLKCVNCDRQCSQAPTSDRMTIEQVKEFVRESLELNHKWTSLTVVGGEPMTHPDIFEIFEIVRELQKIGTKIKIYTNGVEKEKLSKLPWYVFPTNSEKLVKGVHHEPVNQAPIDQGIRVNLDRCQCFPAASCSIAYSMYGWYFTGPCVGIDRVFGFGLGVKTLKEVLDSNFQVLEKQQEKLCNYCGHALPFVKHASEQIISPSWREALERYEISHHPG